MPAAIASDFGAQIQQAVRSLKVERDTWKAVAAKYKAAFDAQTRRFEDLQDICFATQAELQNERIHHRQLQEMMGQRPCKSPAEERHVFGTAAMLSHNDVERGRRIPNDLNNPLFDRVQQDVGRRNYGTALAELERLLRGPLSAKARAEGLLLKSSILKAAGPDELYDALAACSEALELCDRISDLESFLPKIQYQRGVLYYQLHMLQQARDAFSAVADDDWLSATAKEYRTSCDEALRLQRAPNRRSGFDEDRTFDEGFVVQLDEKLDNKRQRTSAQLRLRAGAASRRMSLPRRWPTFEDRYLNRGNDWNSKKLIAESPLARGTFEKPILRNTSMLAREYQPGLIKPVSRVSNPNLSSPELSLSSITALEISPMYPHEGKQDSSSYEEDMRPYWSMRKDQSIWEPFHPSPSPATPQDDAKTDGGGGGELAVEEDEISSLLLGQGIPRHVVQDDDGFRTRLQRIQLRTCLMQCTILQDTINQIQHQPWRRTKKKDTIPVHYAKLRKLACEARGFAEALESRELEARCEYWAGRGCGGAGDYQAAISHFKKALRLDVPNDDGAGDSNAGSMRRLRGLTPTEKADVHFLLDSCCTRLRILDEYDAEAKSTTKATGEKAVAALCCMPWTPDRDRIVGLASLTLLGKQDISDTTKIPIDWHRQRALEQDLEAQWEQDDSDIRDMMRREFNDDELEYIYKDVLPVESEGGGLKLQSLLQRRRVNLLDSVETESVSTVASLDEGETAQYEPRSELLPAEDFNVQDFPWPRGVKVRYLGPAIWALVVSGGIFTGLAFFAAKRELSSKKKTFGWMEAPQWATTTTPPRRTAAPGPTELATQWWSSQVNSVSKVSYGIIAANSAIHVSSFLVPQFWNRLWHVPARNVNYTQFTSMFVHGGPMHLFVNMYATYNFLLPVGYSRAFDGHALHLLSFYLATGVCSGFAQHWATLITPAKKRAGVPDMFIKSGGASGALLGILGVFCMEYPRAGLGIIFLPFHFEAQYVLPAVMLFDLAHLSGTLLGVAYSYLDGKNRIWRPLVHFWKQRLQ
ncbi:hypothetical protein ACEQ8H_007015 [Pleosporales sp. CAS-2024a]